MNFKKIKLILITPLILLVFFALPKLLNLWAEYLWFKEVGYQNLFIKTLIAKVSIGTVVFLIVFFLAFLTLHFTLKVKPTLKVNSENVIELNKEKTSKKYLIIFPSLLMGLFAGLLASTALWENILLFLNQVPFGTTDPVFNRDISFYFFNLSLFETIYSLAILFLIILAGLNFVFTFYLQGLGNDPFKTVIKRLGYFAISFFLLLIVGYQLKLANLLYSPSGAAFGASYTDLKVTLPYYYLASLACIISAITIFLGMRKGNVKKTVIGPLFLVFIVLLGTISQSLVQNFIVNPNEINKEKEYIGRNITMTNQAFGLDKIKQIDFAATDDLSFNDLEEETETVTNIRINDYRPAQTIFNQLQSMRLYYRFLNVDVDRYKINGQSTQVFLSARELDQSSLQEQSQTWINKYLKYTHGYGAVVAPVNKVTPQGQPLLLVQDIPPTSSVPELEIKRPEIYFGQLTNNYIIVNTLEKEFDYPLGNDNAETIYEGKAGISLSGINRLLFALNKGSLKMLVSSVITDESKIVLNRNIQKRVQKIAPFLAYDKNPYLVISEGRLFWIIDAYTLSNKYPYSEPIRTDTRFNGINYIRNSAKVVVDAYNGNTDFYLVDETDPIVKSYANIFPGLFKSLKEMPEGLKRHLRYPTDLFDIQTTVYQDYHMKNPRVFYNREDAWSIARELYHRDTQLIEPYYINMKLPQSEKLEFLLMRPYTPLKKDNMVAWLAARNDAENYGQLVLFKFPKQKLVYGPMQIESRISGDSDISKELSLWDQRGSSVIRGNLLVIPIKNSILYVEPLYIQADNPNSLPEVKRIIVAYKNNIVMEETLEEALYQIFSERREQAPKEGKKTTEFSLEFLTRQARETFEKARAAAQSGNWAEYGRALQELENLIIQLEEQATNGVNNT